ncbi:UNVERIFIED_ORG: hypothetical protein ABIB52_004454 [Arthrobacter sp. UYCu721]
MTARRRSAPDPEWVLMYRQGIPTPKIAAAAGVAETTVRYHLAIAARQDPRIRGEHQEALPDVPRQLPVAGRRNLADILALYEAEDRLPASHGASAREKALAVWRHRRRQEAEQGILSPTYARALDVIPGWREQSTKRADDEARWKQRLKEVQKSAGTWGPRTANIPLAREGVRAWHLRGAGPWTRGP